MGKRSRKFFLSIVWVMTLLVACNGPASEEEELTDTPPLEATPFVKSGADDTLRVILWQAPTTLNPHLTRSRKDLVTARIVYDPLATFNSRSKLIPVLAQEIPTFENGGIAADGKSVTWRLKEGVLWSDGQPFTADDVVFTFEFIIDRANGTSTRGAYRSAIDNVKALDDFTVKINFTQETPTWNLYFTGLQGVILPRHVVQDYPGSWLVNDFINQGEAGKEALANLMIGTGPYRPVEARQEEVLFLGNELVETNRISYEANPVYREEGKPYFGRLQLKGGGTTNGAARSVFRFEEADFAWNLQVDVADLEAWQEEGYGLAQTSFGSRVERILLNRTNPDPSLPDDERSTRKQEHPFLGDLRVRQAFAHAIDREAIAELYGRAGCPIASILPRFDQTCDPNYEALYPYDLEKAAALLDEAGWVDTDGDDIRDNGRQEGRIQLRVTFQTSANAVRQRTQEIVRDALQEIGVDVEIVVIDASIFSRAGPVENFYADLQEIATSTPNPDSGANMARWLCNTIPNPENEWRGRNYERYCNEAYDALYQESTGEIDPAQRDKLFAEMNKMIIEDVVTIPIIHRGLVSAVSNTIAGVELTPWDSEFWKVQDWRRVDDDDS